MVASDLRISNYRLFDDFKIEQLARVNLIAGWNDTGKSSLLEAVYLVACRDASVGLQQVLGARGENTVRVLFHDYVCTSGLSAEVHLGKEHFRAYIPLDEELEKIVAQTTNLRLDVGDLLVRVESSNYEGESRNFVVSGDRKGLQFLRSPLPRRRSSKRAVLLRGSDSLSERHDEMSTQWDDVTLTPQAKMVVEALRIIEPKVKSLNFLSASTGVKVLLEGEQEPVLLGSLGDGIRHLLMIALSLVGARGGALLIDEVETGLHYTTLTKLWRLIFEAAKQLDVQVFATTHSWDCIAAFGKAWDDVAESEGLYLRLDRKKGHIQPVTYTAEGLSICREQRIEVR